MKKINFLKNPLSIIILLLLIFIVILLSYNYNLSNNRKMILEKFIAVKLSKTQSKTQSTTPSTTQSTTSSICISPMCSFEAIINPSFIGTPQPDKYKIDLTKSHRHFIGLNKRINNTSQFQDQSDKNLVFTIPTDKKITTNNLIMINSPTSTASNKYMFIIMQSNLTFPGVMPVIYDTTTSSKDPSGTQLKTFNFTDKDYLYVLNPIPDATFQNKNPLATITLKNKNQNINVGTKIILSIIFIDSTSTYFIQICKVESISNNVITLNRPLIPVIYGSTLKCTPYILPQL